jgi:hypothetical protein
MCFLFLQVMRRFLQTGFVPHHAPVQDYEPPHEGAVPVAEPAQ